MIVILSLNAKIFWIHIAALEVEVKIINFSNKITNLAKYLNYANVFFSLNL